MQVEYENKSEFSDIKATVKIEGYFLKSQTDEMIKRWCEDRLGPGIIKRTPTGWKFRPYTAEEWKQCHSQPRAKAKADQTS